MTVFRAQMKLFLRNMPTASIYFFIFIIIALIIQFTNSSTEDIFSGESLNIVIFDEEKSPLSEALIEYLENTHTQVDIKDDKATLQEALFFRNIEFILRIPADFSKGGLITYTASPGSMAEELLKTQINTFLNNVNVYVSAGFKLEEALKKGSAVLQTKSTVIFMEGEKQEKTPQGNWYHNAPYPILSMMCYLISLTLSASREPLIKKRILCSSYSLRRQNSENILGVGIISTIVWGIFLFLPCILYQDIFFNDPSFYLYLLNSALLVLIGCSFGFLVGNITRSANAISGITNLFSLGMSFLCGVFVPLFLLGKGVLAISRFLPVYWYIQVNDAISYGALLTKSAKSSVWQAMGIQFLFILAFFSIGLAVHRYKVQRNE